MAERALIPDSPSQGPVLLEIGTTALGLYKRVTDLDTQIKTFARIASVEDYEIVGQIGREAAKVAKEATEFYKPETDRLYRLWNDKTTERAKIVNPAERIKDLAGRLTGEWQVEQERLRMEEQRRREEQERQRAEAEQLAEAAALELEGRHEEAEAMIEAPVVPAPVMVNSIVPKVSGMSKPRDNYQAEIFDMKALAKAVGAGKVPVEMIEGNMTNLNAMAKVRKEGLNYPGVRVVNRPKSSFRS